MAQESDDGRGSKQHGPSILTRAPHQHHDVAEKWSRKGLHAEGTAHEVSSLGGNILSGELIYPGRRHHNPSLELGPCDRITCHHVP